ncbi:MAG: endonuclease [Rhodobacteraceae bacterium]|nr:endonuclease [Paracoccaceae bacterium]
MADRARLLTVVAATALLLLALARYGMIDSSAERTVVATSDGPAGRATAVTAIRLAADDGPAAVRQWLRTQIAPPVELPAARAAALLYDLDEDPQDNRRLRLVPTARSVPKDRAGAPDGWGEGRIWPAARGLAPGLAGGLADLHNRYAAEPELERLRAGRGFGPEPVGLEPADALKGDVARTLFYMDLRYDGADGRPDLRLTAGHSQDSDPSLGDLCALLQWNEADPVDAAERRRNEWIAKRQGNRNPFIDRPEFARLVWGPECGAARP